MIIWPYGFMGFGAEHLSKTDCNNQAFKNPGQHSECPSMSGLDILQNVTFSGIWANMGQSKTIFQTWYQARWGAPKKGKFWSKSSRSWRRSSLACKSPRWPVVIDCNTAWMNSQSFRAVICKCWPWCIKAKCPPPPLNTKRIGLNAFNLIPLGNARRTLH